MVTILKWRVTTNLTNISVRYPNLVQHVRANDEFVDTVERQALVHPELTKEYVHAVVHVDFGHRVDVVYVYFKQTICL